jgi:hypothetical protein
METSKTSTGEQLNDLTLFAVATPANPFQQQATDEAQTTLDTCGLGSEMPLAHYDLLTQSWKMSEDISLWGDYKSLENLPKSGMTRSGVLYQQPAWVRPIDEIASSFWPTPTTQENEHPNGIWNNKTRRVAPNGSTHSINLADAVQKWNTPQAHDAKHLYSKAKPSGQQMLSNQIYKNDPSTAGGKLNPVWVEWLMGFPAGWTDLED